jgi:ribosomal RNA assembly protein
MSSEIFCQRITELKREKKYLERTLNLKINIKGRKVTIQGDTLDEYEAEMVLDAISLGFSARTATLLKDPDFLYEKINIKDHTRRKNLELVRGRIIGTHGKTKKTIEQISGCAIVIKDNIVGVIGPAESMEYAITAITNILKGSKQTNAYKYLERINTSNKKRTFK